MTIEQVKTYKALARHFKIKTAVVRNIFEQYLEGVGEEHPVVDIELPNRLSFRIGVTKSSADVTDMVYFRKFEKSELYAAAMNLFENEEVDFVVFPSGTAVVVLKPASYYDGLGGVFLKDPNSSVSFSIEPIENYLQSNYPLEPTD